MNNFFDDYKKIMSYDPNKKYADNPTIYDEIERLKNELDWYNREITGHNKVTDEFMNKRNAIKEKLDDLREREYNERS